MGGSVSFIDGHIDNVDRCVCCGKIIPEGRQVCFICGTEKPKKQTNYDRIRNMSVEELARFLESTNSQTAIKVGGEYGYVVRNKKYIQRWLESEVDTK